LYLDGVSSLVLSGKDIIIPLELNSCNQYILKFKN
jgi:hypothetical protein